MEAVQPLHKGSSNPHGPGRKHKPEKPVVVPLPVTEVANLQTQKPESNAITAGSANPYSNRTGLNGTIAPVHGSKTIYDQGAEIRYGKFQESLAETGDINHPDTQKLEKSYMSTLSISQIQDYRNRKNGTYLPKTLEEQAAAYQAGKSSSEADVPAAPGSDAPAEISPVTGAATESVMDEGFALPEMQEDAVRTTPTSSNSDPNFNHTVGLVKTTAKAKRAHATKEKAEIHANAAAAVPAGERKSKAKGRQVEQLDQQKTGSFSASGFKVKLKEKIKSLNLPTKQGQAENFKNRNNIHAVNGMIRGDVMDSKRSVTGGIETVARQQPDEAKIAPRTAIALPDPKIGSKVGIRAAEAMPPKRGASELSEPIAKSYKSVEQQFAKNHITDEQLAQSNEPDFINVLNAKKAAKAHAEQAPGEFKNAESKKLEASKREAQGKTNSTMDGMHQSRKGLLDSVTDKQHKAGEKNTAKHQDIVDKLNTIYAETKKTVDGQLNDLEIKVAQLFDDGAKKAKETFEKEVTQKLEAYKARRYGEWYDVRGYGNRIEDAWNKKLPDEVDKYYKQGKDNFMTAMDRVITGIAELVTTRLNAAKASITAGRQKVVSFVKNLPADVKKAIKGDIDAIQGQFKELENSINDKESSLIDSLATKYNNALKEVDELIVDIKKRNRGFLAAVEDATVGVAKTIMEIRKTLTELLSGAVSAVMAIVADPIGFLSNLIAGVSQGITNFGTNIWTHLKNGFFGWLTGAMKNISFTLPEDLFSLKGIFSMSSQILGLTWNDIRSIGSSVVGEPVMKVLETGSEKGLEAVQMVRKEGAAGLWEHVKDQFADIKATVMDTIMDIIKTQAIQAGIKFIMSLLTPAGAFVKAAMMIIDLVKFFVQKAAQIMELVKAFTDGIKAIASGNVGAVAKAIESALGRAIPVVIGFLASLAGLGGLADKVVGVIHKIRQRIKNAIVKFWNFVKGKAKGLLGKFMGKSKKDNTHEPEKQKKIDAGFMYLKEEEKRVDDNHNNRLTLEQANKAAKKTKAKYPVFSSLKAESKDDKIIYRYTASPENIHETGTELEKTNNSDVGVKIGAEISAKYGDRYYRAKILVVDQDSDTISYKFIYDQLKNKNKTLGFEDFNKKVKSGDINLTPGKEHNKYKIDPNTVVTNINDGVFNLSYSYFPQYEGEKPPFFKVSVSISEGKLLTHIINGSPLSVKTSGSRGYNTAVSSNGKGTHRAHLIADWFKGSAYKEALNIINTSEKYNLGPMARAERNIVLGAGEIAKKNPNKMITFDITVDAKYYILTHDDTFKAFKSHLDKEEKDDVYKILQNNRDPRWTQSINYLVDNFKADGESITANKIEEKTREDRWIK